MIATLVQLMGEDKAFEYLKGLHKNVSTSTRARAPARSRRWRAARPRCRSASSTTARGEKMQGFPVETITPSEGTGAEIGSMSIVKGAKQPRAGEEVLRMGADAAGAAVRRRDQAVPAAVEQGDAGRPERARLQEDQADRLRLREVRRERRAQAPDRALGEGRQLAAALSAADVLPAPPVPLSRDAAPSGLGAAAGRLPACCPGTRSRTPAGCEALPQVFGARRRRQRPDAGAAARAPLALGSALGRAGVVRRRRACRAPGRAAGRGCCWPAARSGCVGLLAQRLPDRRQAAGRFAWLDAALRRAAGAASSASARGGFVALLALLMLLGASASRGSAASAATSSSPARWSAAARCWCCSSPTRCSKALAGAFVDEDGACSLAALVGAHRHTSGSGAWAAWPAACAAAWPGTRCSWRCSRPPARPCSAR